MQQLSLFDGEPTAKPSVELSALYEAYLIAVEISVTPAMHSHLRSITKPT